MTQHEHVTRLYARSIFDDDRPLADRGGLGDGEQSLKFELAATGGCLCILTSHATMPGSPDWDWKGGYHDANSNTTRRRTYA